MSNSTHAAVGKVSYVLQATAQRRLYAPTRQGLVSKQLLHAARAVLLRMTTEPTYWETQRPRPSN